MKARVPIAARILLISLLVSLTAAAYWRVAACGFVNFDDDVYVTHNPYIQSGISVSSLRWALTSTYAQNWHPLTWLSHMTDWALYKNNPAGHHVTNLLLHLASTVLLFLLLMRMTGAVWRSAAVATLFALHPLHVESVAWVAERKDVLSTFFWMFTILAYIRYTERPNMKRYAVVAISLVLGLMSKPMVVTLPIVLLLLDYWPLRRYLFEKKPSRIWRRLIIEKIPLLALSLGSGIATFYAQRSGGAVVSFEAFGPGVRVANALAGYAGYVWKMLLPLKLAVYYPHPGNTLSSLQVLGSAVLFTLFILVAVRLRRKAPYIAVGIAWYTITLLPVIGLVQVGGQAMADRYAYIPLVGLFIAVVWAVSDLHISRVPAMRTAASCLVGVVILAMAAGTYRQVGYWRSSLSLFSHAIDVAESYVAHDNYGFALAEQGNVREALRHFNRALEINQNDVEAHANAGAAMDMLHKPDEATAHYIKALQLKPDHPRAHYGFGTLLVQQGKLRDAADHFSAALRADPTLVQAHVDLGDVLLKLRKPDEAAMHYSSALALGSRDASAYFHLGSILEERGDLPQAIANYREAIRLNPKRWDAANNLAWIYATQRDPKYRNPEEAVRLALITCNVTHEKEPLLLDTLAAAYASGGRYDQAANAEKKALKLTLAAGRPDAVKELRRRLHDYETRCLRARCPDSS